MNKPEEAPRVPSEKEIVQRFGGREEMARSVAESFVEHAPHMLEGVKEAIDQHDSKALRMAAHRLKGSIGHFTTDYLYPLALELEDMGRTGEWEEVEAKYASLAEGVGHLRAALSALAET